MASSAPTGTVSSSPTRILLTVPATGEGISVSTLSVETSSSGSSTSTWSPSAFSQRVTVPSVTDSPRAGIVTVVPSAEPPEVPAAGGCSSTACADDVASASARSSCGALGCAACSCCCSCVSVRRAARTRRRRR